MNRLEINVYTSETCSPCKLLKAQLDKIDFEFDYINIDNDNGLLHAMSFGVMATPTMVFILNDKVVKNIVGFRHEHQIVEEIKKHLGDDYGVI